MAGQGLTELKLCQVECDHAEWLESAQAGKTAGVYTHIVIPTCKHMHSVHLSLSFITYTHMLTHTHKHTHKRMHIDTHMLTNTYTHAYKHTCTHAHTHTLLWKCKWGDDIKQGFKTH